MRARLAVFLTVGALGLAACSNAIPDSGLGGANGVGNYKYDTVEYFNASIGDRVHFAVDQSTLSPEALSILDAQAAWLIKNTAFSVLIEGHTDEQGTREYNLALGARRASAAKAYLASKGVSDNRMTTVSYGKERPIALCSAEKCWSQNRRAVTVVRAGGSS